MARHRLVVVALLVVLAGCSTGGPFHDTTTATTQTTQAVTTGPTPTAGTTTTATVTPTTTAGTTPSTPTTTTATPTPTPPRAAKIANPWGSRTVTVGVVNRVNDRNVVPLVNRTLTYWNAHAAEFGAYDVHFVLRPNATSPDVRVAFVATVTDCGNHTDVLGCSPLVDHGPVTDRPLVVRIQAGYTDASTVDTMKHEFGHLLGIRHGEAPEPLMSPYATAARLRTPNATDRALPWTHSTLSVYVDYANVSESDRATYRDQVGHALDYYQAGANGTVPANVSFVRTSNRSAADVVVSFPTTLPSTCGGGSGSCREFQGADPDEDGAPEWYTRFHVTVAGVDAGAVGWYVGYQLGYAFGAANASELPPAFQHPSYETAHSDWWT